MTVTAVIGRNGATRAKQGGGLSRGERGYVALQRRNNAGHTVINEFGTFKIHLVPSGIFARNTVD